MGNSRKFNYGYSKVLVCLDPYASKFPKSFSGFSTKVKTPKIEVNEILIKTLESFEAKIKELETSDLFEDNEKAQEFKFERGKLVRRLFKKRNVEISEEDAESLKVVQIPEGSGYVILQGYYGGEELILISPDGFISIYCED